MSVNSVGDAGELVLATLSARYASFFQGANSVAEYLAERVDSWKLHSTQKLRLEFPFSVSQTAASQWCNAIENKQLSVSDFEVAAADYLELCNLAKLPDNQRFWRRQLDNYTKDKKLKPEQQENLVIDGQLLANEWQKALDVTRAEWEHQRLAQLREQLISELDKLLSIFVELGQQLEELGFEPGVLLDLSKGSYSSQDIEAVKRWVKYLAEDEGVRSLCDLLGKLRDVELSGRIESVKIARNVEVYTPDINSREEIVGLKLGRDLEHAIPSELALLSDPDASLFFDLKYVESRLMCFDMQGMMPVVEQGECEQDVELDESQGPMIICVDTSGSMSGSPETVAKAVTLFMASKAREQKRPCYLINFSTDITTLDLSEATSLTSLIRFLKMSFHGGTDVAPAINHALDVMDKSEYEKADLLVISDFIMSSMPSVLLEKIQAQKVRGNNFYSLVVGSHFMTERMKNLFDQEWIYDPRTSSIQELIDFRKQVLV